MEPMKIGIIGIGNVGSVLGRKWAAKGHDIRFGIRDLNNEKFLELKAQYPLKIHGRDVEETIEFGEILVLAVPWESAKKILRDAKNLEKKIINDCTNPIKDLSTLQVGQTTSAAEIIQDIAKTARIVKGFNTIGANIMEDPIFNGIKADTFICGNDIEAKKIVATLAEEIGFNVVDVGELSLARYLEPLALLWINMSLNPKYQRNIAFKLLKR